VSDRVTFLFPILAIEAHPARFPDAEALRKTPVPVIANPALPEDELHIISDGRRIILKLKPRE
jgi:hypothetical protein